MKVVETSFKAGKYMFPVKLEYDPPKIRIGFRYNPTLLEEVKNMANARWLGFNDGPKQWEVNDDEHNRFQIAYLQGQKPYAPYDLPLINFTPRRKELYDHQVEMVRHGLTRHYCIFACEMGTGKTLAAIEIMEASGIEEWWYIAPKSALISVQLDMWKWGCKIRPKFFTYEALVRQMKNWTNGLPAPRGVIFDESSKLKTPTSQRSQAAYSLAAGVRKDWDGLGYAILMSGSPAPKSPADWWHQCYVARPGFLKEGSFHKFQQRLAIIKQEEGSDGVKYPRILGWKDSDDKCSECAEGEKAFVHTDEAKALGQGHDYIKTDNEVAKLHKRMSGLVLVKLKKDCLDLPEKVYNIIKCKPSIQILNAARLIMKSGVPAAQILMRLRELSDGFQYHEKKVGDETCPRCEGNKVKLGSDESHCHACEGIGTISKYERSTIEIETPKDQAFLNLLEQFEEDGRLVAFGAFSATIDRLEKLIVSAGWTPIILDGRGWRSPISKDPLELLKAFQEGQKEHNKICFAAHPGSGSMGLTLTASQAMVYYSNTFNAEEKIQSMDRIHRPGSRGANYYELIHLPTDLLIVENLKKKRDLQSMSLGEIAESLEKEDEQSIAA
jgi:SNF2 family DNA or RNA helicase